MGVAGVLLLLLNALDYVLGWNNFHSAFGVIGIVLAAGGAALVRRSEKMKA
jgi:hypothetical protein